MIKRTFLALSLLVGSVVFSPSVVADEGDLSIGGLFGGVGLTGQGMTAYGTNGFGYGGYLTYAPSDLFDLDIDFVYSPHSNGANSGNMFYTTIGLKTGMTFDQLSPFLTFGVGIYRNAVTLNGVSDSAAAFGFNVGGGMDIDLGKWIRLGLVVRYHPVLGKNAGTMPGVDDIWDALIKIGILFRTGIQGGWD